MLGNVIQLYVCVVLVGFFFYLRVERRGYAARGRAGAWLAVRLSSLPIAAMTVALVVLPSSAVSGMEALAVFYLLALVVAPVFWFGAHWLAGRLVSPPLHLGESSQIALSPLIFIAGAAMLAQALQPVLWQLLRALGLQ
jgi:hypothetical protein